MKRHDPFADLNPDLAAELARGVKAKLPGGNGNRPKGTYDLRLDTLAAVKTIAGELEVPVYAVAQKLLDHALAEYQAGRLELVRRAVVTAWRLE